MRRTTWLSLLLLATIFSRPLADAWHVQRISAQAAATLLDFAQISPPTSIAEREAQFVQRAQVVIDAAACGMDARFDEWVAEFRDPNTPDDGFHAEELTAIIIAKIFKYYQLSEEVEGFRPHVALENSPCNGRDALHAVLRLQVNEALLAMRVHGQSGSSGLPCYLVGGSVHGEYDVALRNLTRILHLQPINIARADVLDAATRAHVRDNLLTLDGGPGSESYSIYECGNTEMDTGTPEDRAEHYTFADDVGDAIGDISTAVGNGTLWFIQNILFPFLLIVLAIALLVVASALIAAITGVAPEVVMAALVAGGVVAASVAAQDPLIVFAACAALPITSLLPPCRIPETENHLLMMNSARYLTNQARATYLRDRQLGVPYQLRNNANGLAVWFLEGFQGFLEEDFSEYNARPYQRYSINAILNLYDYAEDAEVKRAAGMVLDYLAAKYAVATHGSRRVVNYRRLTEHTHRTAFYAALGGADHLIHMFMLFSGQTDWLLPEDIPSQESRALELIYAAVSSYRMPTAALEVAVDKSVPYFQVIHHEGVEIFYSTPAFLLSAGGVNTGPANLVAFSGNENDTGAALPTVLIPSVAVHDRNELIRFEGGPNHEGNTCVAPGFACGLNPVIPTLYDACKVTEGDWTFINSAACPLPFNPAGAGGAANPGPYFYAAVYSTACTNDQYCVSYEDSCTAAEVQAWQNANRDAPMRAAKANIAFNLSLFGPLAQRAAAGERARQLRQEAEWLAHDAALRSACASPERRIGMLEAVPAPLIDHDNDGDADANDLQVGFDSFRASVLMNNPASIFTETSALFVTLVNGTYHMSDSQTVIRFDPTRYQHDEDEWAIRVIGGQAYDEWADWKLAQGDVMQADDAIIVFRSPISGLSFTLDLSDEDNPTTTPISIERGP